MRFLSLLMIFMMGCCSVPAFADKTKTLPPGAIGLKGGIDGDAVDETLKEIDFLVYRVGAKNITIVIDSGGGDVDSGFKLVTTMEDLHKKGIKFICIADHDAQSIAFFILQGCDVRLMTKRTVLMAHQPSLGLRGDVNFMEAELENLRVVAKAINEHQGKRLKMGVDGLTKKIERKKWTFGWEEAVQEGAVDGVVEPSEIPPLYLFSWNQKKE